MQFQNQGPGPLFDQLRNGGSIGGVHRELVKNVSGSDLGSGALVYLGGYNRTAGTPTGNLEAEGRSLFVATPASGEPATHALLNPIPNGAWGYVSKETRFSDLDTSAASLGAPVYLDVGGARTLTDPSVANPAYRKQIVGQVSKVGIVGTGTYDLYLHDYRGSVVAAEAVGLPLRAVVDITDSQVKNLRATPKGLVAAPGAGYALVLDQIVAELKGTTTAYTITNAGDDLRVKYDNGAGQAASDTIETTGFLDALAAVQTGRPNIGILSTRAQVENKGLCLHNIGAAEFSGGNAANILRVTVFYRIVALQ